MTTFEEIKKAIAALTPCELSQLRAWFDEFDAAVFDENIELGAKAGKFNRHADQAMGDHRNGRSREL